MIIDFHTHLFFDQVRKHRERFFSLDPAFRHIYENERARMIGVEELIQVMDRDEVDISVTFGFPWRDIELCRDHHDYILEGMKRHEDRLIGLACVSPQTGEKGAQEIERCLKAGMMGAGEIASYEGVSEKIRMDFFKPVMEMIRKGSLLLLLHTTEQVGHYYPGKDRTELNRLYEFICDFPEINIVLAHWGGGLFFYELMPEVARALKRVYYDTAASPFLYSSRIYLIAQELLGSEKILYGSDFPLIRPKRYFKELKEAGLAPHMIEMICGLNAKGLLNL